MNVFSVLPGMKSLGHLLWEELQAALQSSFIFQSEVCHGDKLPE